MRQNHINLIEEIQKALKKTNNLENNQEIRETILFYDKKNAEVNNWLREFNFDNEEIEIDFFKNYKSKLTAKLIYYQYLLELNIKIPPSKKKSITYYKKMLEKYSDTPKGYNSFYKYNKSQSVYRDHEFYLRKNNNTDQYDQYKFDFKDDRITTKMEYGLAMLTAREQIVYYIESILDNLETKNTPVSQTINSPLEWTGTNLDIIELIYALHHQKVINGGNNEVKELAKTICQAFNLNIEEHIYRYYIDIKRRKTNKTRFLQSITDNLNKVLEMEQ